MALLKLVPDTTTVPLTSWRFIAAGLSALLIVASIGALAALGLNLGVDFRGGVTVEVADGGAPIDAEEVRATVADLGLGDTKVKEITDFAGSDPAVEIVIEQQTADGADPDAAESAQQDAARAVQDALVGLLGEDVEFRKVDVVGPTVSGELIQKGVIAVVLAIGMMLIYIWFRFEWQFSIGAILALVHDVVITLGVFALTRLEFNLAIIAAILTIVGYSMNDTVVVYDRVRENLRRYKKKPLKEVVDLSINDTLSRTVMTSVTTLIALVSLYVIGGEVLRGFTFAMIWGILIGTYSSIFVAAPILLATGVRRDWSTAATAPAAP